MTTRKFSKFLVTHAMATAAVAATVLSPPIAVRAAVLMDNPAGVTPNTDPAMWDDTTNVTIGNANGQDASVILDNTGDLTTVNVGNMYIGNGTNTGRLTVTGKGANWNAADRVFVGYASNSQGFLDISNGGSMTVNGLAIGRYTGSTGIVTLTDGSTLTNLDTSAIGSVGTGILNILSGSTFHTHGTVEVGNAGQGIVTIDGVGSQWISEGDMIRIGNTSRATGEVNVTNGGLLDAGDGWIQLGNGSTGILNISDGGVVKAGIVGSAGSDASSVINMTNGGILTCGNFGTRSTLNVRSGSTFTTGYGALYNGGTVTVADEGSKWISDTDIQIGASGWDVGTSTLNIHNGGLVEANNICVGYWNGGSLSVLNVTDGGTLITNSGSVSFNNGHGIVNIDGEGSAWINNGHLSMVSTNMNMRTGTAEINLSNGGLLATNYITGNRYGTSSIHFNGGTLQALTSHYNSFLFGDFKELTLTDTASRPALTMQVDSGIAIIMSQVFTGTGGITKTGGGSFLLAGNQAYKGLTDVKEGTLTGRASFAGGLTVRDGATYSPGGTSSSDKAWTANIAGNYMQESGGTLMLDVGSKGSDMLVVGGNVSLDGILNIVFNGVFDQDYYVLIDNLGSKAINGTFSDILFGNEWVELTLINGMHGGGSFEYDDITYYLSYAGDSATGSLYGGNDVVFSMTNTGGGGPAVPEPASLSLLGLGAAALIARRRK